MLQNGFSGDPSVIYQSGSSRALRQVVKFPNPFASSGKLSFSSSINLLCVSSGDILYLYDTFSAATYEIRLPTDWEFVEGAVIGAGGELYVVSFDFSDDEYFIRRVTLQ
jgi:hypothetical protein